MQWITFINVSAGWFNVHLRYPLHTYLKYQVTRNNPRSNAQLLNFQIDHRESTSTVHRFWWSLLSLMFTMAKPWELALSKSLQPWSNMHIVLQWRPKNVMVSQITGDSTVCQTVFFLADSRNHQSSTLLVCVRGIRRWLVDSPHKGAAIWKYLSWDLPLAVCPADRYSAGVARTVIECINSKRGKGGPGLISHCHKRDSWAVSSKMRSNRCLIQWVAPYNTHCPGTTLGTIACTYSTTQFKRPTFFFKLMIWLSPKTLF